MRDTEYGELLNQFLMRYYYKKVVKAVFYNITEYVELYTYMSKNNRMV